MRIVTIGVYGFSGEGFFDALQAEEVDAFCDLRQRRGVRGATYAFANSRRLQKRLAELGISYFHLKELAPTRAIRELQDSADKAAKIAKRKRTALDPSFITAYRRDILTPFDPRSLLEMLDANVQVLALFCVERDPAACHRSLVAEYLQKALGWDVQHIVPEA
jgi:uncharacterized protein (DUF488 family)